ncbi:ferredoxin [Shimia sp. W99]
MTYALIEKAAQAKHLEILGGFHPAPDDEHLSGFGTLLMFGPREPGFWQAFTTQSEYLDGTPNPVDRWSSRVITSLAVAFNAQPFFPYGGPPYQPFFQWALRTGRCHSSPISLLVHDTAGLFASFRGALAFQQMLDLPAPLPNPCTTCTAQPCRTSCPVDAFTGGAYHVDACRAYLTQNRQGSCMSQGCAARRACPVSQSYGRVEAQSALHMQAFLTNGP